jgi:hypothetical protein
MITCPLLKSSGGQTFSCNGSCGITRKYPDEPCTDCPINWDSVPVSVYCNKGMHSRDLTRDQCLECRDDRIECEFAGMY